MNNVKKSMEWLQPIELSTVEAQQFHAIVAKPVSSSALESQRRLFQVAKKLKESAS
jgi:hypothetical protein